MVYRALGTNFVDRLHLGIVVREHDQSSSPETFRSEIDLTSDAAYAGEMRSLLDTRFLQAVVSEARVLGNSAGRNAAEGFRIIRSIFRHDF